jgi:nucleobase:cation symporter-1, NCS1 family
MYQMGWVLCFAIASILYFSTNRILPAQVVPEGQNADSKQFEGFAESEGYLEGDSLVEFGRIGAEYEGEPVCGSASNVSKIIVDNVHEKV